MQSATGFGLVMIASPLLMYFYDPKLVIILIVMLATVGNTTQSFILRRDADHAVVKWLIAGSIIGQPVGFLIYSGVSGTALRLIVSLLILFSLTLMKMLHLRFDIKPRNSAIAGLVAGVTTTTTGMGGPSLILYFSGADFPPATVRATSITYFFLGNFVSLITFIMGGVDLAPALFELRYLLPGLILGIAAGQALFRRIPAKMFRRALYVILVATCLHTVYEVLFA